MVPAFLLVLLGALLTPSTGLAELVELQPVTLPDLDRFEPGLRTRLSAAFDGLPKTDKVVATAENASQWGELGMLLHAHGMEVIALACYHNAGKLNDSSFEWAYLEAYSYEMLGQLELARAGYDEALTLDPDSITVLLRLGNIYLQNGDTSRADSAFSEALGARPNLASALAGLGKSALVQGDYAAARQYLQRSLSLEPAADQLHYPLSVALRKLG